MRLVGEPVTWKRPVWTHNHVYNPNAAQQRIMQQQINEQYGGGLLHGPLRVVVQFWFARPETHYIDGFERRADAPTWYLRKTDLDNLAKLVLDAMSGIIYADDHQVVSLDISKRYSDTSVGHTEVFVLTL